MYNTCTCKSLINVLSGTCLQFLKSTQRVTCPHRYSPSEEQHLNLYAAGIVRSLLDTVDLS